MENGEQIVTPLEIQTTWAIIQIMGSDQHLDTTKKKKPFIRKVIEKVLLIVWGYILVRYLGPYIKKNETVYMVMMNGLFWVWIIASYIEYIIKFDEISKRQKYLRFASFTVMVAGGVIGIIVKKSWVWLWGGALIGFIVAFMIYVIFSDQIDARLDID